MPGITAEDRDLASRAPTVTLKNLHGGGLPSAVRAKERKHLSPRHMQVYTADSLKRAIPHLQARDVNYSLGTTI